jgi:hypothetical protein
VSYGTNITSYPANIGVSPDATSSYTSGTNINWSSPVSITVTAQNGTPQVWTVNVSVQDNSENDITSFTMADQTAPAVINTTAHTVSIQVSYGTNITSYPANIGVSPDATSSYTSGTNINWSSCRDYRYRTEWYAAGMDRNCDSGI